MPRPDEHARTAPLAQTPTNPSWSFDMDARSSDVSINEPVVKIEDEDDDDETRATVSMVIAKSSPHLPDVHVDNTKVYRRKIPYEKPAATNAGGARDRAKRPYSVRKAHERRTLLCCDMCNHRRVPDVSPNTITWHGIAAAAESSQGSTFFFNLIYLLLLRRVTFVGDFCRDARIV